MSLLWLGAWLAPPLLGPAPLPPCNPQPGIWRGVDHLHTQDHAGHSHGPALLDAAHAACLDFLIITDHEGVTPQLPSSPTPKPQRWLGTERRGSQGRHLGDLSPLLTLNHPTDSGVRTLSDLSPLERARFADGTLSLEVWNTGRLLKTPPTPWVWATLTALGPARLDLLLAAASLPGPDLRLWLDLQASLGRPVLMRCGSDAHGDLGGYRPTLSALITYLPATAPLPPASPPATLALGQSWCVNELFGPLAWRLRVAQAEGGGCAMSLQFSKVLPAGGRWTLYLNRAPSLDGGDATRADLTLTRAGVYHLRATRDLDVGLRILPARLWALSQAWVITPDGRCLTLDRPLPASP